MDKFELTTNSVGKYFVTRGNKLAYVSSCDLLSEFQFSGIILDYGVCYWARSGRHELAFDCSPIKQSECTDLDLVKEIDGELRYFLKRL